MRILYAVCSLGLGHATRSLPLIRALLERGEEVYILSHDGALKLLKRELGDSVKEYIDFPGYPPLERGWGRYDFYLVLFRDLIKTASIIFQERLKAREIVKKYKIERIISDGRYGIFSLSVPSFLISHQLRFMVDFFMELIKIGGELGNGIHFLNFKRILVPDYEEYEGSLSGDLSHNLRFIPKKKVKYIGILSSYKKEGIEEDIDYLFIISGYIKDKKGTLISKLRKEAEDLPGKKVFLLGDPGEEKMVYDEKHDITLYTYVGGEKRVELMNRAKFIISRSGYTTIMDLTELEKNALFIPTPGMSEQMYLGKFHREKGTFYAVDQEKVSLVKDIEMAKRYRGIKGTEKTDKSIERFLSIIYEENAPCNPIKYLKQWPFHKSKNTDKTPIP